MPLVPLDKYEATENKHTYAYPPSREYAARYTRTSLTIEISRGRLHRFRHTYRYGDIGIRELNKHSATARQRILSIACPPACVSDVEYDDATDIKYLMKHRNDSPEARCKFRVSLQKFYCVIRNITKLNAVIRKVNGICNGSAAEYIARGSVDCREHCGRVPGALTLSLLGYGGAERSGHIERERGPHCGR